MVQDIAEQLDSSQRAVWLQLNSPAAIQIFLDQTPYSPEDANRSPVSVVRDGVAHCLDGALFAAAALRRIGHPPLIVDLLPDPGVDDDHVLAIYKCDGYWGAVAKSNFVGLRFREAIYRTLRELVLSYFESYFNIYGAKSLRYYTRPLNLAGLDKTGWMVSDVGADAVEQHLHTLRRITLITPQMATQLQPVDKLSYEAGTIGINLAGVYQPQTQPGK
jgi:hypothetical protein